MLGWAVALYVALYVDKRGFLARPQLRQRCAGAPWSLLFWGVVWTVCVAGIVQLPHLNVSVQPPSVQLPCCYGQAAPIVCCFVNKRHAFDIALLLSHRRYQGGVLLHVPLRVCFVAGVGGSDARRSCEAGVGYKFLPQHTSVTNGCKQMQQLCMVFVHMWMGVVGASKPQHPVRAVDTQVLWVTGGSGGALSSTGVNSWRMCINSCCCGISLRNGLAVWPPLRANGGCWSWCTGCVVVPLCLSVVVDCGIVAAWLHQPL